MQGLRTFAHIAEPLRRFPKVQILPPQCCLDYLQEATKSLHYAYTIKDQFLIVSDPDQVAALTHERVWENWTFHQRAKRKASESRSHRQEQSEIPSSTDTVSHVEVKHVEEARQKLAELLARRRSDLLVLTYVPLDTEVEQSARISEGPGAQSREIVVTDR